MAGAGWRQFVAGEQLTDTKMQNFLMDQAVMRFADAATRDTALAGVLSEGMVVYLDSTKSLEIYDGSSWGAVTPDVQDASPTVKGLVLGSTNSNSTFPTALGGSAALNDAVGGGSSIGNTSIGHGAGLGTTTGAGNVFIGGQCASNNTTGNQNVVIGVSGGGFNTTGQRNTLVGFGAGALNQSNQPYSQNTFLGSYINFNTGNWYGDNNTLIGYEANQSAQVVSNQITLGNSAISSLRCQVTTITALSDIRDKTNVTDLPYGLDFVKELKPVSFDWNMRDGAKVGDKDIGFIAQDLAALEDKFDAERLALTLRDNPEKLEATPGRLIPILVKAIQELTARVEELENAR
jgi:hypothetical protein